MKEEFGIEIAPGFDPVVQEKQTNKNHSFKSIIWRQMPRKEQFAIGAALTASALAFILSKFLAWFVLLIGLGLIWDSYIRDLIWGSDRLTREQIQEMPAEEYKKRVLGNPKTERWVNWRRSGYDAFKKHMRKLAREAVIFMLVTPLAFITGAFAFLYHDAHKPAVVPVTIQGVPPGLIEKKIVPCSEGDRYVDQGRLIWSCQNGIRTSPVVVNGIDLSAGLVPKGTSDIPPPPPGFRPIESRQPQSDSVALTLDLLVSALWFGVYGIPAGLGFWLLYRAIYFAVRG
jgi:hypothetical protein